MCVTRSSINEVVSWTNVDESGSISFELDVEREVLGLQLGDGVGELALFLEGGEDTALLARDVAKQLGTELWRVAIAPTRSPRWR